LTLGP
jgi:hypothetical protein